MIIEVPTSLVTEKKTDVKIGNLFIWDFGFCRGEEREVDDSGGWMIDSGI